MRTPAARPAAGGSRLHALDAFRGFAALWVVMFHVTLRYPRFMQGEQVERTALLPGLSRFDAGVVPVLWFFLISGFVIAWTVDRCRTPADFVVSRFSRLYPAFWASIAVTALLSAWAPLPGARLTLPQVLANLTMLQDYLGQPAVNGVFWSLTAELTFYAWVLGIFACGYWRVSHRLAFGWACIALAAAVGGHWGMHAPWRATQLLLLEWAPFFAGGMMLYRLWQRQHVGWSAATLALCVVAIAVAYQPVPAASCFAAMGLIAWATRGGLGWLEAKPLLWLGSVSYTLYLTHETASFTVIRALDDAGVGHPASVAAAVAVSLALAGLVSSGVERPALRFIRQGYKDALSGGLPWRRKKPQPLPGRACGFVAKPGRGGPPTGSGGQ